ncbi:hypothetical protein AUJ38_02935 [bacterium CG1_02_42_9]|nr:MAG: hypothetical protein AUJ38_02935 [bacterium CG1_02_42_9]
MSSRSLNKVILIGNLTRDPELRYTPSGTPVCSFGLATNRSWVPSGSEERQEETEFHSIVAWSKLAELCAQLLTKGRKVYIEGRLQTRSWETPDGEKRVKTEIVSEDMIILDSRRVNVEGVGGAKEEKVGGTQETVAGASKPEKETTEVSAQPKEEESAESQKDQEEKPDDKKEEKSEKAEEETDEKPDEKTDDDLNIDKIPF